MSLSITAANVIAQGGSKQEVGIAGETVTAGKPVYKKASDDRWHLTNTDQESTEEEASCGGIALTGSSNGQPIVVCTKGDINLGATLVEGGTYFAGPSPGTIDEITDGVGNFYRTKLGIAISTTILRLDVQNSGAVYSAG